MSAPTSMRGLAAEVPIDPDESGIDEESAINCDGLQTVQQTMLAERIGAITDRDFDRVCAAVNYELVR